MKKLSQIVDLKKIKVVNKNIDKAHGLPNECYTNPDYLSIERKKIFENKWVVIGVGSSLPNIGDAKPFDLLGIPLIILRDKNNKIRVFHNVCSHRGYKLISEDCHLRKVIKCPYHSWSYDFTGKLVATPHIGGVNIHDHKDFKKNESNLKEVRSIIWLDLIIVNISENAISFEEYKVSGLFVTEIVSTSLAMQGPRV